MVFQFFPAVTVAAVESVYTSVFVVNDFVLGVPSRTLFGLVEVEVGLAAEVLPIVREDATLPLVFSLLIWTPHCLEVEAVEICIPLELVNQVHGDLTLVVGEGTEVAVLASPRPVGVALTELGFVHLRMIKLFDCVVRKSAGVCQRTNLFLGFAD